MTSKNLVDILGNLANRYPADLVASQKLDIPRIAFNIGIGVKATGGKRIEDLEICDLGGGVGLFSVGCAAYGMKRSVLVDDFDDSVNHRLGDSIFSIHRSLGVEVVRRNVVASGIADLEGSFDIITTFDSMEHWHHSPKRLFHDALQKLKPKGVFVLGVPNCVNMRKRITTPLGICKWSDMGTWYDESEFRGHVREPDVDDLHYIARDMGLENVTIYGRNWLGYYSGNPLIRFVTPFVDYPLRIRPQLCSDIYVVGNKR